MNNEENYEFWAIIELFGHSVLAGKVTKSNIGEFVQVNVPELETVPAWTKILNPKAIYAISPVTKEVAISKADSLKAVPVDRWSTEEMFRKKFAQMEEEGKIKMIEQETERELPY